MRRCVSALALIITANDGHPFISAGAENGLRICFNYNIAQTHQRELKANGFRCQIRRVEITWSDRKRRRA